MGKRRLTDAGIQRLPRPEKGQREYFDKQMPGLAVRVTASGTKSFVYFYRFGGRLRRDTLGRYSSSAVDTVEIRWGRRRVLSLKRARRVAERINELIENEIDPHLERDAIIEAAENAANLTYSKAVDEFIEKWSIAKRKNRTAKAQKNTLLRVNKRWLGTPVSRITRQHIHDALDRCMAEEKPVEANRRYAALATYFRWLHSRGYISDNPMIGIERPFDGERPSDRVWNDEEVATLWDCADDLDHQDGAYLRLLLLLGHRPDEVGGMRWDEISSLDAEGEALWTIPPHRHKAGHKSGRSAITPLPRQAVHILKTLPHLADNPFVFPGRGKRNGTPCSATIGSKKQAKIQSISGIADFNFKTARPTVRTGLDRLDVPPHVSERCLNHTPSSVGEKYYSKHTYEGEQREAFEAWAQHIKSIIA